MLIRRFKTTTSFRKRGKNVQRGEGEAYFLLTVLGLAVLVSVGFFAIGWIQDIKEKRANYGKKPEAEATPPVNIEEMGSYEVHY